MGNNLRAFAIGGLGSLMQRQQQQQEMQQKVQMAIMEANIKAQIEKQQQQEQLKQILGLIGQGGGMPQGMQTQIPSYAQGLRPQPIQQFFLKNPLAINAKDMLGFRTPEDMQKEQFQQNANIWQTAQGIPAPNAGLVRQPQDVIRRSLLARGVRNQMQPQFRDRTFKYDSKGDLVENTKGGMLGTAGTGDIKDAVTGIQQGHASPVANDYSFRDRTAIVAEAQRRGLNLQKMTGEWIATKKFIQSANSPTQLRLRQAIESVQQSVGNLRQISSEFKRANWTPLNKAELYLALSGVDPSKRDIAARYITQLSVIKDELGQAFMGGNSPTDRTIQLAEDILNKNYGFKQLNSALDELEKNLQYRMNAIYGVGAVVQGGEVTNQNYMPQGKPVNRIFKNVPEQTNSQPLQIFRIKQIKR